MPTENRSSNTEMVSVPRELLETIRSFHWTQQDSTDLARAKARAELIGLLAKPAEQHQGEPVALPEPYGYLRELDGQFQLSVGSTRPPDRAGGYATPWAAIYAGKQVEQLRYKAELYDEVWELATGLGFMNVTTAISTLRDQLAEQDALLREVRGAMREYEQGCDQFPPFHHNQLMDRIEAALSASAEPEVKP